MTDEYEMMNKELKEMADILKNDIDKIVDRFHYRTMVNRSYTKEESLKIQDKLWQTLHEKVQEIDELWGVIG